MNGWTMALVIAMAIYAVGVIGMAAYMRFNNWPMAFMWPLTILWMLFGTIQ